MPFLTAPASLPTERLCRSINVPNSREWLGIFDAILLQAVSQWAWEAVPENVTPEEAAAFWQEIVNAYWDEETCALPESVPTPYWDDAEDTDDEAPADDQPWYGHVEGNTFIEDIGEWVVAGFLAEAVSPQAAIFYRTYERKFRLAFLKGGPAGAVRVLIDNAAEIFLDLTGDEEEVVEYDFMGDPDVEEHEILIVNEGMP